MFQRCPSEACLLFVRSRTDHELRLDKSIKFIRREGLELHGAVLESEALFVCVLGNLGGHVVADFGVEAGDKHETM